jgi:hypothetical protein
LSQSSQRYLAPSADCDSAITTRGNLTPVTPNLSPGGRREMPVRQVPEMQLRASPKMESPPHENHSPGMPALRVWLETMTLPRLRRRRPHYDPPKPLTRNIPVTVTYADNTRSSLKVPADKVSEFVQGLVPAAARMRRRDRARQVTILVSRATQRNVTSAGQAEGHNALPTKATINWE